MSVPDSTLVSVVIPFYSNADWLYEAVDSVLAQTHSALEILVVDDGSPEHLDAARLADERIIVTRQPNAGPGPARNRGISLATGEFIAFLDSDDLWKPEKVERQLALMQANGAIWSCGSYETFGVQAGVVDCSRMDGVVYPRMLTRSRLATPTIMVRADVLRADETLRFSNIMRFGQDLAMWLHLARAYPVKYLPGVWTRVRMRGTNAVSLIWTQVQVRAGLHDIVASDKVYYRWRQIGLATRLGLQMAAFYHHRIPKPLKKKWLGYVLYVPVWLLFVIDERTQKRRAAATS